MRTTRESSNYRSIRGEFSDNIGVFYSTEVMPLGFFKYSIGGHSSVFSLWFSLSFKEQHVLWHLFPVVNEAFVKVKFLVENEEAQLIINHANFN